PDGDRELDRPVDAPDRLEPLGIADHPVLEPGPRLVREHPGERRVDLGDLARAVRHPEAPRVPGRRHATRRDTPRGLQARVPARHREAVGLADGRRPDDVDPEVEIAGHAPDHRELLEVLLAEDGDVRTHEVKELAHDRRDAAEVTGAMRTTEVAGE